MSNDFLSTFGIPHEELGMQQREAEESMNPDPESPTPTPRTDALYEDCLPVELRAKAYWPLQALARTLERELLTAQSEVQQLREELKGILHDREMYKSMHAEVALAKDASERQLRDRIGELENCKAQELGSRMLCKCAVCSGFKVLVAEHDTALARITELEQQVAEQKQELADHAEDWAMCGIPRDSLATKALVLSDENRRLRAELEASPDKSDWCPVCKQGWDCGSNDQQSRIRLAEATEIIRRCGDALQSNENTAEGSMILNSAAISVRNFLKL